MAKKGKKFIEAKKLVDSTTLYAVEEAVELVKKLMLLNSMQL